MIFGAFLKAQLVNSVAFYRKRLFSKSVSLLYAGKRQKDSEGQLKCSLAFVIIENSS